MKIKTMTVGSAMKVTKNYSTVDGGVSMTVELEAGDNPAEVHKQLSEMTHEMVKLDIETGLEELSQIK